MSSNVPISSGSFTAPTPQNTPLNHAPISLGLSRPTVPDITEDSETQDDDLGLVQDKLASLIGKSSGYIESLPIDVKLSVEGLKGIQVKQNDLHTQFKRECLELEKKYLNLAQPLYERRQALIIGSAAPTKEEITAGEEYSIKDNETYTRLPKDTPPSASGIPHFWLTALRNHLGLAEIITDRDAEALKQLLDVRLVYLEAPQFGFKLEFVFGQNEYFDNELLQKTYLYQEEVGYGGDFVYDRAEGCEIKWKEDKDLTKEFEIKKQRNKNTNRTRLVRKAKPTESFFNFFTPPVLPSEEVIDSGEVDPEELEEIEEKLEIDYQLGEDFKEKIIPRAVDYFTGKALEYDFDDQDDDDFEDLEDDDEEGDFDDDDDDDDDDDLPASRRRLPPKKGKSGAGGVNPEECKQQ